MSGDSTPIVLDSGSDSDSSGGSPVLLSYDIQIPDPTAKAGQRRPRRSGGASSSGAAASTSNSKKRKKRSGRASEGGRPSKLAASSSLDGSSKEPIVLEEAEAEAQQSEGEPRDSGPGPSTSRAQSPPTAKQPSASYTPADDQAEERPVQSNGSTVSWPSAKSIPPPKLSIQPEKKQGTHVPAPEPSAKPSTSSDVESKDNPESAEAEASDGVLTPERPQPEETLNAQLEDTVDAATAAEPQVADMEVDSPTKQGGQPTAKDVPMAQDGSSTPEEAPSVQGDQKTEKDVPNAQDSHQAAEVAPTMQIDEPSGATAPPLPPRPETTAAGAPVNAAPPTFAEPNPPGSTAQPPHPDPSRPHPFSALRDSGRAVWNLVKPLISGSQHRPAEGPSLPGPLAAGQVQHPVAQQVHSSHSTNAAGPIPPNSHEALRRAAALSPYYAGIHNPQASTSMQASRPQFTSVLPAYPGSNAGPSNGLNSPYGGAYPGNSHLYSGNALPAGPQPPGSHLSPWAPVPTTGVNAAYGPYGTPYHMSPYAGPSAFGGSPPGQFPPAYTPGVPGASAAGPNSSAADAPSDPQNAALSAIANIFSNVGQSITGAADTMGQLFQQDEEAIADMANLKPCSDAVLAQLKKAGLKTKLKTHQSSGLRFLVNAEHRKAPQSRDDGEICLWSWHNDIGGRPYWRNRVALELTTSTAPDLPRGAILSDAMGLGKTLTVLALILAPEDGKGILDDPGPADKKEDEGNKEDEAEKKPGKQENCKAKIEAAPKGVKDGESKTKGSGTTFSGRRSRSNLSSSPIEQSDTTNEPEKARRESTEPSTPVKRVKSSKASRTGSQSRRPLAKVDSNGRPVKKQDSHMIWLPPRTVKCEDELSSDELVSDSARSMSPGRSQLHSERGDSGPRTERDDDDSSEEETPRGPGRSGGAPPRAADDDTPSKRVRPLAIESDDNSVESTTEDESSPKVSKHTRKLAIESDEEDDGPVGSTRRRPLAIESDSDEDEKKIWEVSSDDEEEHEAPVKKPAPRRPTLIVCPLSVLSNWCDQASTHTDSKKMKYAVLHGPEGQKLRKERSWNRYNFIVTTYDVVRSSYKELGLLKAHKIRERRFEREVRRATRAYDQARKHASKNPEDPRLQQVVKDRHEAMVDSKAGVELERKVAPLRGGKTAWTKRDACLAREQRARQISGSVKATALDSASESDNDSEVGSDARSLADSDEEGNKDVPQKQGPPNGGFTDNQLIYLWTGQHRKPENDRLFKQRWLRIVLDEAHVARNSSTNVYDALRHLRAERRIAVTGTPLVNSTCDLGSLAAWIGVFPFKKKMELWNQEVEQPVKNRKTAGINILRSVTKSLVCLRTKEMKVDGKPIVELPELKINKYSIELRSEDRDFYDRAEVALRKRIVAWAEEGELNKKSANMLVFMARLRQLANDRRLVPDNLIEEIETADYTGDGEASPTTEDTSHRLSPPQIAALQSQLAAAIQNQQDCTVCSEPLAAQEAIITYCGHTYHRECITTHLESSTRCLVDQKALKKTTRLITLPEEDNADLAVAASGGVDSAKINALVEILNLIHTASPTDKVVVFSNFVSFLKLASSRLKAENIPHTTFYGAHSKTRRAQTLTSFARPLPMPKDHPATGSAASASSGKRSGRQSSLLDHLEQLGSDLESNPSQFVAKKTKAKPLTAAEQRAEEDGLGKTIPRVILMSMGAGSVGINLIAANHVVLLDPWWQSALEMQARDRTHRIGQTKPVHVYRLVSTKTIEERVIEISTEKMELTKFALSGVQYKGKVLFESGRSSDARLKDLGTLFGLTDQDLARINRARMRPAWQR